jgi:hypothetical protein
LRRYDIAGFPFAPSVCPVDAQDTFYQSGRSAGGGTGVLAFRSGNTVGREFILALIKINKTP